VRARYGNRLAIDCRAAHRRSAKSESLDHVLEFSREKAAPAIIARFAYKAGQSAQAIRLQPAMQRPTWDLSLARQLRKWHAVFEVVPQQHKPLDRVISLRLTQLGE